PDAKPWAAADQLPYPFEFQLLDEDWDHFAILMDSAITRIPVLAETGIKKFYNGPESFTPDNQFILGEAPELRNFFVGAGFNSVGIASAGGAGRALAEWITEGEPSMDLTAVDIRRFAAFNGNNQWLHDRVAEVLGLHYAVPWPNRELASARPFRRSPAYHLLAAAGACFRSQLARERADVTVTRLSAEEFLLVSSAASTERDLDHIRRRTPAGLHASVVDVTSQYAVYGVMGPRSRDLLTRLTRSELGDEAFPFGTSREI